MAMYKSVQFEQRRKFHGYKALIVHTHTHTHTHGIFMLTYMHKYMPLGIKSFPLYWKRKCTVINLAFSLGWRKTSKHKTYKGELVAFHSFL